MRLKISFHWAFFLVAAAAVCCGFWQTFLLAYAIILLHEMAHIIVAKCFRGDVKVVRILPFGVSAEFSPSHSFTFRQDLLIALAGPTVNLVLMSVGLAMHTPFFVAINAGFAVINLLPALPLDGGRALRSFLSMRWGSLWARNFTLVVTKVTTVFVFAAGVVLLFVTKMNFSLLLIGAFLATNWVFEVKNQAFSQMRGVLFSREKLHEGCLTATHLVALANIPARFILKRLRWHRYCLVDVVDENSAIIATLTETEIIDGLSRIGIRAKLRDLT